MTIMILETPRLSIRPLESGDLEAFLAYVSDEKTMHYLPEEPFNKTQALDFISKHQGPQAEAFALVSKDTQQLIGHFIFEKYFGDHTYEIGWVLNPKLHSQGYATEAAKAIIQYGFEDLGLHRIVATCQPENIPSYRVMEKAGMRKEGFFKACIPTKDGWWDEYYYAILETEYFNQKL